MKKKIFPLITGLLLIVIASGFYHKFDNGKQKAEKAPVADIMLSIRVLKGGPGGANPFAASELPEIKFCSWDGNTFASPDESGLFKTYLCEEADPIKFRVYHPDYEIISDNKFVAAIASCESDGEPNYIVPSFYFQEGGNFIFTTCGIEEVTLEMRLKSNIESDSTAIADAGMGWLNEHSGGGGNGGGNGRGPEFSSIEFDPGQLEKGERNKQNIKIWASEYSRLDERQLPEYFKTPFKYFKRGQFEAVAELIAATGVENKLMQVRRFEDKKDLERFATLAARTWTLLGNPNRAKRFYEIAQSVAPYKIPVVKEYVGYLEFRKDFKVAEQVLDNSILQARFIEDKAVLMQDLGRVSIKMGNIAKSQLAASASLTIRNDLTNFYITRDIGNQKLKEDNNTQIRELEQIIQINDVKKQGETWDNLNVKNIPKSRVLYYKAPFGREKRNTPGTFEKVNSHYLKYLENESGQVTKSGVVSTGLERAPRAGDYRNNDPVRGFLSFDLSQVPRNANITNAILVLPEAGTGGGRVFPDFGKLYFEAVYYGGQLNQRAYFQSSYGQILASDAQVGNRLDVGKFVKKALRLGYKRFQIRIRFGLETDNDYSGDVFWIPVHVEGGIPFIELRY